MHTVLLGYRGQIDFIQDWECKSSLEGFTEAMAWKLSLQGSTCSFNKYLLSTNYVLSSILGAWDLSMNKAKIPAFLELTFE